DGKSIVFDDANTFTVRTPQSGLQSLFSVSAFNSYMYFYDPTSGKFVQFRLSNIGVSLETGQNLGSLNPGTQFNVLKLVDGSGMVEYHPITADDIDDSTSAQKFVTQAEKDAIANSTLNTDTDVSGNDWVLDEDDMASDSDEKVPTQQSVKAYTDAKAKGVIL